MMTAREALIRRLIRLGLTREEAEAQVDEHLREMTNNHPRLRTVLRPIEEEDPPAVPEWAVALGAVAFLGGLTLLDLLLRGRRKKRVVRVEEWLV